jgi:glycosyltransferase involved in cell wall biosynthesis
VINLGDSWVLEHERFHRDLRLACWAPVDHSGLHGPELTGGVKKVLQHPSVTPIAMSRHGEAAMRVGGLDPLYIPHAVDTYLFRPRPSERDAFRRGAGLPEDAFIVGMVAANNGRPLFSRKAFPQAFLAFAKFRETHPDAILYVHTNAMALNNTEGGIHLAPLAVACGIPRQAIRFTEQFAWDLGVKREDVAGLMASFDVLLSPSFGEGFGIPIVEAQACGVPVIATNWTAMSELVCAGWLVEGDPWYDAPQDSWFKCPQVDGIAAALEAAYEAREDQELRARAREFSLAYDVDYVMETYWKPVLEYLDRPKEVPPLNRAMRRAKAREKAAA